jgi:hypothetical protein
MDAHQAFGGADAHSVLREAEIHFGRVNAKGACCGIGFYVVFGC